MTHTMRRKRQALSPETCIAILKRGSAGVLALADDDYPYAVPLSYVYDDGVIYFHSAKAGHKLDCIARDPRASFCVIDQDDIVPERFTTYFRSVIAFGRVRLLADDDAKRVATAALARKYAPRASDAEIEAEINKEWPALAVFALTIDRLSGKEAIELVRAREADV